MYDAIVVGGGIVGLSAAYHLVTAGATTLLIDRADAGQATAAGAGIITPGTVSSEPDAWFDLAFPAVAYYPTLIEQLRGDDAGDTGYAPTGQLSVAIAEDEDGAFAAARARVFARQQQRGEPSADDLFVTDAADARRRFPPLAVPRSSFYFAGAARVDGRMLAGALRRAALRHGLTIRQGSVDELMVIAGAAAGVVVDGERVAAGGIIIAGGAWTGQMGAQLGVTIPIEPLRGQIIHLALPGTATAGWPIISAFHGHYIVPWPDSRVVVGATRDHGTGFAAHTTAAGVREVLDEALRVAPGLADAAIADIRVGLRPATPDKMPVLGPVPRIANVYLAAGHGATGLQLGPYSGKLMADLVLDRSLEINIDAFAVSRFAASARD